jgi:hypothetical protein
MKHIPFFEFSSPVYFLFPELPGGSVQMQMATAILSAMVFPFSSSTSFNAN